MVDPNQPGASDRLEQSKELVERYAVSLRAVRDRLAEQRERVALVRSAPHPGKLSSQEWFKSGNYDQVDDLHAWCDHLDTKLAEIDERYVELQHENEEITTWYAKLATERQAATRLAGAANHGSIPPPPPPPGRPPPATPGAPAPSIPPPPPAAAASSHVAVATSRPKPTQNSTAEKSASRRQCRPCANARPNSAFVANN